MDLDVSRLLRGARARLITRKLFVGEFDSTYNGSIQELSLGGANLIFLTLKLLEFKYQHERQALAKYARDRGDNVAIEVHPTAGSLP